MTKEPSYLTRRSLELSKYLSRIYHNDTYTKELFDYFGFNL